ncbi:hypothetical protein Tco_1325698, partial [Tanacetum coccineum]
HSVRSENQANLHAGQQESNQNTGTKDKIAVGDSEKEDETDQDCFELPIWNSYSSTKRGSPREEEQVFLDDLARLQRQEKEANEEAEALRKKPEQDTENLVTQAETAKSSSTNIFSTVSTTAKASGTNLVNTSGTNPVSTASPKEGLSLSETTNSQLILGDPTSAVQTRSKVNKSSEAHAFKLLKMKAGLMLCKKKVDHMETENAQCEGRTRDLVDEDKEFDEVRLSTEDVVSTDKEGVSTDFEKVSTDRPIVSTDGSKVSTDEKVEGTEEHNEGTKVQREGTEEIFESNEEQREGTEEKVESTDEQIKGTEDQ